MRVFNRIHVLMAIQEITLGILHGNEQAPERVTANQGHDSECPT